MADNLLHLKSLICTKCAHRMKDFLLGNTGTSFLDCGLSFVLGLATGSVRVHNWIVFLNCIGSVGSVFFLFMVVILTTPELQTGM